MTTIAITTNTTTYDADDRRAARARVATENQKIASDNQQLIYINNKRVQDGLAIIPDTPLLDMSTNAALKTSYEICLAKDLAAEHAQRITQTADAAATASTTFQAIKAAFAESTPAKQAAALAALQ
jgi:hypothetical protein